MRVRSIRSKVAAVILALGMFGNCIAQSLGTAFSDLWWNPAESGWGVTVDHQQDVMFLTFFVYRTDGSPYWVTALLNYTPSGTNPFLFTGDVYETRGPAFNQPFNPASVTARKVGTATFAAASGNSATLTYAIDGAPVTKSIQRQTLHNIDFSGGFNGIADYRLSNCPSASMNGQELVIPGQVIILHSGLEFKMSLQLVSATCGFVGVYSQSGSYGAATGNFSCSEGTSGTFDMTGMQWTLFGFTSQIVIRQNGACTVTGIIGGVGVH